MQLGQDRSPAPRGFPESDTAPVSYEDALCPYGKWIQSLGDQGALLAAIRRNQIKGVRYHPKKCIIARLAALQFPGVVISIGPMITFWTRSRAYWFDLPGHFRKTRTEFDQGLFPDLVEEEVPARDYSDWRRRR